MLWKGISKLGHHWFAFPQADVILTCVAYKVFIDQSLIGISFENTDVPQ